jgi:hypothetical protein
MALLFVVAAAIVIMLLRGGKLARLADMPLRVPLLAIACAVGTKVVFDTDIYWTQPLIGRPLWLLGFVGSGIFIYMNRHHRGLVLAGLGPILNGAVITANKGLMPTGSWGFAIFQQMPTWYRQPGISADTIPLPIATPGSSPLWFLGDVLPPVFPLSFPFSLGDTFLTAGAIWFLASVLLTSRDEVEEALDEPTVRDGTDVADTGSEVQAAPAFAAPVPGAYAGSLQMVLANAGELARPVLVVERIVEVPVAAVAPTHTELAEAGVRSQPVPQSTERAIATITDGIRRRVDAPAVAPVAYGFDAWSNQELEVFDRIDQIRAWLGDMRHVPYVDVHGTDAWAA